MTRGDLAVSEHLPAAYGVAIVSCDIVGHSSSEKDVQAARIVAINHSVAQVIEVSESGSVIWASGGDGGHVVFRRDGWHSSAAELISRLRQWSTDEGVPLRVTAHYGSVTHVAGADGRMQIVGEGINTAGWMLTRGTPGCVVVSEEFQTAFEGIANASDVTFHDPRSLRDKTFESRRLLLMSSVSHQSQWTDEREGDREQLAAAVERRDGWSILYFAKRLLQTNTSDMQASYALQNLQPGYLSSLAAEGHEVVNPFLGYLGPRELHEVLQLGQLVERRYDEVLCRYGDRGDTMFIILRGEVGVYKSEGEALGDLSVPMFTHREGEIIGELAFTLERNRTADLVALSDVALLSFNLEEVFSRLPERRSGRQAKERISSYIDSRVVEHVSHHVPYLLGPDRKGPLAAGQMPWQDAIENLIDHSTIISVDTRLRRLNFTYDAVSGFDEARPGLFILLSGRLSRDPEGVQLVGDSTFPLIWSNIPGVFVLPEQCFNVAENTVKILHLDMDGLSRLEPEKRERLYRRLRRAAAHCYCYDAFISYNSQDEKVARRWVEALRGVGLRIYIDEPKIGVEFPRRLRAAILGSRAMISISSQNVKFRSPEFNWVLRETRFHRSCFDESSRIFPIRYPGGDHESIAPGFAPIDVDGDEDAAIASVVSDLRRLREGTEDPPFLLEPKNDNDLE